MRRTIVGLQSERQVRAPPPKYDGNIFSLGLDDTWVADVIALPAECSVRHYLLVQDVFPRFLWARPMDSQAAVVEPMREILRARKQEVLYTDADSAFTPRAFQAAMQELGVDARTKTGRNDIATVDAAMRVVKTRIVDERSASGEADWAKHVQWAVRTFNGRKLDYLMERAPKEAKADGQLDFLLQRKNTSSCGTT